MDKIMAQTFNAKITRLKNEVQKIIDKEEVDRHKDYLIICEMMKAMIKRIQKLEENDKTTR